MCLRCGAPVDENVSDDILYCKDCLIQCFTCTKREEYGWWARTRPIRCRSCRRSRYRDARRTAVPKYVKRILKRELLYELKKIA
jgi:hypothetical protein